MSKLNLKDNIWIEGFTREELFNLSKEDWRDIVDDVSVDKMLYSGKTSDIPEELAKECIESILNDVFANTYKNYNGKHRKDSPKESIQSACDKEYCIIYKSK